MRPTTTLGEERGDDADDESCLEPFAQANYERWKHGRKVVGR